jgi:hypothetical protein
MCFIRRPVSATFRERSFDAVDRLKSGVLALTLLITGPVGVVTGHRQKREID